MSCGSGEAGCRLLYWVVYCVVCVVQGSYRHWYDYVAYEWAGGWASGSLSDAAGVRHYTVTFPASCLTGLDPAPTYYLLYFNAHARSVVAYSQPLTVSLSASSTQIHIYCYYYTCLMASFPGQPG